jgi:hypothetical protein
MTLSSRTFFGSLTKEMGNPSTIRAMRLGEKELLVSKYITTPNCLAATCEAEQRQTCVLPEDDWPVISVS